MEADKEEPFGFNNSDLNPEIGNFSTTPFKVGDQVYMSNEHFFQSKKFTGTDH